MVDQKVNGKTLQFNGILTLVDRLTKYARLIPCYFSENDLIAQVVAQLLLDKFVHYFGVPKNVSHDIGPCFTSHLFTALWQICRSKSVFNSSLHPQTDGQTERTHFTLE